MSLRASGESLSLRPVSDGGYDAVERAGQRQIDAIYSAVGESTSNDAFSSSDFTKAAGRRLARAMGLGRNVDVYA